MSRNIKAGKITLPMDVRSADDVPAFENMLSKGPMAVVLVYADWCGHCDKFKKNVWSPLKSAKNRSVNMASVHYDQLANTSLKNAKIDGYPSLLLVGQDKKPATFNTEYGTTNAMPNANDLGNMKKIVTSPKANNMPSLNLSNTNNSVATNLNTNNFVANNSVANNSVANNFVANNSVANNSVEANINAVNYVSPNSVETNTNMNVEAVPPNLSGDEVVENSPKVRTNNQGTTPILRGGRLYKKLSGKRKSRKSRKSTRKNKRKN